MKIAMIGGGVGGLMGALYLTKLGYEVTIYEKEHKLGGRMAFVERDGFRIDEGPTIVLLPEMFRDLFAQAGIDPESIELLLCDPLYTIRFTDGKVYTKYPGRERQLQEVEEQFPDDKEGFIRFMDEGQKRFDIGKPAFLEHDFVHKANFWTFRNIRNLMKLKPQQSVHRLMESYFRDERLQLAYSLQALYIGGDPYRAPAMYSLVPFSEHEHGVYYVKGGYASIIPVMEQELRSRGTDIRLETPVKRIVKENGRATAVETAQGTEEYDAIVYNGDFPGMNQLAPMKKQKEYTPSSGCVLLYFGLDKVYEDVNVHQFFIGDDYKEHMEDVFVRGQKTENPAFYTFHPSVIDDSLAPEGKSVLYVLVPVPSGTEIDWQQDEEWIGRILDRMETLSFPDLRKSIEWMDVRTPKEAEAFGLFKGGSFGIGPTLRQSGVFRPQVKPDDTDNLYAVGASVHPGGGIPIVMQGAKLLADRIHSDLKERGGS